MHKVQIGEKLIGPGEPVFVIAEVGVNHNGDVSMARSLIDVAVDAGADAIKFQTFQAERLVTADAPKAEYQLRTTLEEESQSDMLRRLELSAAAHRELKSYCNERGAIFLSTPFDEQAADFLDELQVPAFKISSGDLTNWPLLQHTARKGKPIILSTGMSTLDEVADAVAALHGAGCEDLILMHCTSNYPTDPADVNLLAMETMRTRFDMPVGFSDHTEGIDIAIAAAAIGACAIEKHFTLDRQLPGPDHLASLEPAELRQMIKGIRRIQAALGDGIKVPTANELTTAAVARRSLIAAQDIPPGAIIERDMIVLKRPGTGLAPSMMDNVLGRRALRSIPSGSILSVDMFE